MKVCELLDANKDKFNNFFPAEKKMDSSTLEYVLPYELFDEFMKYSKDISTEEFNIQCNQSKHGFLVPSLITYG